MFRADELLNRRNYVMAVGEMIGVVFFVVAVLLLLREWRIWEAEANVESIDAQIEDMARRQAMR